VHHRSAETSDDGASSSEAPQKYAGLVDSMFEFMCGPVFRADGMVHLTERDNFVDLGCGHGQVLLAVREVCPTCRCWGVELDDACFHVACAGAHDAAAVWAQEAAPVGIVHGSIDDCFVDGADRRDHECIMIDRHGREEIEVLDLAEALSHVTVVFLFLGEWANLRLRHKLLQVLPVGARIVTQAFQMGEDWPPDAETWIGGEQMGHPWFLYRVTEALKADPRMRSNEELARRFGTHWIQPPPNNYKPAHKRRQVLQQKQQQKQNAQELTVERRDDLRRLQVHVVEYEPPRPLIGLSLVIAAVVVWVAVVYIALVAKILPQTGIAALDWARGDTYFCHALPMTLVTLVVFRYWGWLSLEFFKNA